MVEITSEQRARLDVVLELAAKLQDRVLVFWKELHLAKRHTDCYKRGSRAVCRVCGEVREFTLIEAVELLDPDLSPEALLAIEEIIRVDNRDLEKGLNDLEEFLTF